MINQLNYGILPPIRSVEGYRIINPDDFLATVSPGSITDSTGNFQIISNATLNLDMTTTGIGGYDNGQPDYDNPALFRVFILGDINQTNPPGLIASSNDVPLMPSGYNVYALIGYYSWHTFNYAGNNGFCTAGNNATRRCFYKQTATIYSALVSSANIITIDLSYIVPPQEDIMVNIITTQNIGASTKTIQVGKDLTVSVFNQATTINSYGLNRTSMTCPVSMRLGHPTVDVKLASAPPGSESLTIGLGWSEFNI